MPMDALLPKVESLINYLGVVSEKHLDDGGHGHS